MSDQMEKFQKKYYRKLQEPIIQKFLKDKNHENLFRNAITQPTDLNRSKLNEAFAVYYKKVKIINYISKLIHFYSIDFDKKITVNKKREILNLDSPFTGTRDAEGTSKKEVIPSSEKDLAVLVINDKAKVLQECVENEKLFKALDLLSEKQLQIINLIYIRSLTNKETAQILNTSEQSISYNHRVSIEKLRKFLQG